MLSSSEWALMGQRGWYPLLSHNQAAVQMFYSHCSPLMWVLLSGASHLQIHGPRPSIYPYPSHPTPCKILSLGPSVACALPSCRCIWRLLYPRRRSGYYLSYCEQRISWREFQELQPQSSIRRKQQPKLSLISTGAGPNFTSRYYIMVPQVKGWPWICSTYYWFQL